MAIRAVASSDDLSPDTRPPRRAAVRGRAKSALYWSVASRYATRCLRLVATVILARLLLPEDFGVMAMAWAFLAFVANFGKLGLPAHIVRLPTLDRATLSTIFWINLLLGAVLGVVTLLSAPFAVLFYRDPEVGYVVATLSIIAFSIGVTPVPAGLLRRDMRFGQLAIVEVGQALAEVAFSITLALLHFGVWALVFGSIAGRAARVILLYACAPFRPGLTWRWECAREAFQFGGGMLGTSLAAVLARNADNAIIGAALGSHGLGLYSFSNRVMRLPGEDLVGAVVRVLVPRLAAAKTDAEMASLVRRAVGASLAVVGPAFIGLAVTAPWLVPLVFGEKWSDAVLVLQLLAPVAILQSSLRIPLQVYIVKGRTGLLFAWTAFYTAVCLVVVACGLPFGLHGVATGLLVAHVLLVYPWVGLPKRALRTLQVGKLLADIATHGAVGSVAWVVGMAVVAVLHSCTAPGVAHVAGGMSVLVTFAALYSLLRPIGVTEILALLGAGTGASRRRE